VASVILAAALVAAALVAVVVAVAVRRTPDNKVAPATIRSQACSAVMERKQRLVGMNHQISSMGFTVEIRLATMDNLFTDI
jgi:hypothetical protein